MPVRRKPLNSPGAAIAEPAGAQAIGSASSTAEAADPSSAIGVFSMVCALVGAHRASRRWLTQRLTLTTLPGAYLRALTSASDRSGPSAIETTIHVERHTSGRDHPVSPAGRRSGRALRSTQGSLTAVRPLSNHAMRRRKADRPATMNTPQEGRRGSVGLNSHVSCAPVDRRLWPVDRHPDRGTCCGHRDRAVRSRTPKPAGPSLNGRSVVSVNPTSWRSGPAVTGWPHVSHPVRECNEVKRSPPGSRQSGRR
jgi:hypothetical protein